MRRLLSHGRRGRIVTAAALVLAAMVVGIPAALAHHPVVSGSAACSADGQAVVTWHLQNSETLAGTNRTMVVDSVALTSGTLTGFGAGTVVAPQNALGAPILTGTSSYPGSQSGTVTLTVVAHWVDVLGNYVSSVGHVTKTAIVTLPGLCPLPSISVVKTASPLPASLGQAVGYGYKVTNTGNIPLTALTVIDDKLGAITLGTTTLAPGAFTTGTASHTVVLADFPGPITNTATATGKPPSGPNVSGVDHATVALKTAPAITIVKTGPLQAHIGDPVVYTFKVTNTGDVPLTAVSVNDDVFGLIGTIASLAPGNNATLTFATTAANNVTNTATACGTDPLSKHVCADSNHHTLTVIHPAIEIVKTGPAKAHPGDAVTYHFSVHNTGDVPLTNVSVDDNVLGHIGTIATLGVGVTDTSLSKTTTAPADDVTNTATACGADPPQLQVCADAHHTLDVIHPAVTLTKTGTATAHAGDSVTYHFSVHNTGDVTLLNMSVDDDVLGHIGDIGSLAPGATTVLDFTAAAPANDVTNTGTACGLDPLEKQVCGEGRHTLDVIHPAVTVTKTGPARAHPGDSITYHFAVQNTGDVPLVNVSVDDDVLGHIGTIPVLAVGQTVTLDKTTTAPESDVRNVGTACGLDPLEKPVCGDGDHTVDIVHPGIDIEKTAQPTVHAGDTVTYTFTVHNTGDVPLSNVSVDDNVLGHVGTIDSIAAGDTATLTKDMTVPAAAAGVDNSATACGLDQLEIELCDTAVHHLTVLHPSLTMDKKVGGADHKPVADALLAHQSNALGYTIVIHNTGDTPVEITALSDTLKDAVGATCGNGVGDTLAPDESTTCTYTTAAGAGDAHNVASVTAVDPLGGDPGTVSVSDETFVHVIHPAVTITKTPNPKTVEPGQEVTFTYVVTNTGDTTLSNVAVNDDVLGFIGSGDTLAAGASKTFSKTVTIAADSPRNNVGTVCAVDALQTQVCDNAKATISIVLPLPPQGRRPTPHVTVMPPPSLPRTGFRLFLWLAIAIDLMAAGLAMMEVQRRWRRA